MAKVEYKQESNNLGHYGSDFLYGGKYIFFPHIVRGLKSNRYESSYIDYISIWKKEINEEVVDFDDFGMFSTYLQFFCKFCEFTDDFINKYDVKQYHINLIRRMYFSYDSYDDYVNLGYKRPYGNSYVLGDIEEEYFKVVGEQYDNNNDEEIEKWHEENDDMLLSIHMRTMEIFDLALEELYMPLEFINKNEKLFSSNMWEVSPKWIRKNKLERVLK